MKSWIYSSGDIGVQNYWARDTYKWARGARRTVSHDIGGGIPQTPSFLFI